MNQILKFSPVVGLILGVALTTIHISEEERTIPPGSQCRYFLPFSTDLGAWLVGAYVLYSGFQYTDGLLTTCGAMIISIHTAHYMAHKITSRLNS